MATDSVTVSPTYNGDSVSLTAGMIVRLAGQNNNVVRAQADSAPHAQGVNGVVISGASAPTTGCVVVCTGKETVQMESGLTLAVGQTVYVSPNVAGKGTNILPAVVVPIGTICDVSAYASGGTVEVDVVVNAGSSAGGGGAFPGFGPAPPLVSASSKAGTSGLVARADHTHGSTVADWGTAAAQSVRYFAVDGQNGSDANQGWSDASQAAAGLVAVQTLARLLQIIPRFGNGRKFRAAVRSGNYASDTLLDLSGFTGYSTALLIATDTVASASAVAFAGDTNDTICAGMTTATGMNAAGYNPTAYSTSTELTPMITLQLAGGGTASFPGSGARPYGARLRFDAATTTVALRNFGDAVLLVPTPNGAQLILAELLPANPVSSDVCYLEMPNVSGPTSTLSYNSQGIASIQLCGFQLGTVFCEGGAMKLVACETDFAGFYHVNLSFARQILDPSGGAPIIGMGARVGGLVIVGGNLFLIDWVDTATSQIQEPLLIQAERWAAAGMIVYGGTHAVGNNIIETIGTNSSTLHGAASQIWAPATLPSGVMACGLAVYGGYQIGRIKFSNMGSVPGLRINGAGLGVALQGLLGGVADGNLDVGVDLSPNGLSANTLGAVGCTIADVPGNILPNSLTGTNGDIRLSDGTIVTWAQANAGLVDGNGNYLFGGNNAPLGTKVVAATTTVALGNVAPASVTSATPTAWTPLVINGVKYLVPLWPST